MSRTATRLRGEPTTRLAGLARQRPEWQTWIGLLDIAWSCVQEDRWEPPLDPAGLAGNPAEPMPLLHGRALWVNGARARKLLQDLASAADREGAPSLRRYRPSEAEALELMRAAICQRHDVIETLAANRQLHPGALVSVAQLLTLPVLQRCRQQLHDQLPAAWSAGHCPVCGAWPVLAERRGIDRSRRLRCGRCAADWEVPWLSCIFCGEREHTRLGSLTTDERGDGLRVETCDTCRGYLKSIPALQGFAPLELLIQDLETVELDLVALDRGYRRPPEHGFPLEVQLESHASGGRL